jgi:hypothetical protein
MPEHELEEEVASDSTCFDPRRLSVNEKPLAAERDAMRHLLERITTEVDDLETLCKHIPRIVSVATTTARIQAALDSAQQPELQAEIHKVIGELEHEENPSW